MNAQIPPGGEAPAATDEDILPILVRHRDEYQWSWNLSKRLINMYYGTQYTEKDLKALYKLYKKAK